MLSFEGDRACMCERSSPAAGAIPTPISCIHATNAFVAPLAAMAKPAVEGYPR